MSFCDKDTLKSFVGNASYLTRAAAPDGLAEAILQADTIINSYTGESIPTSPAAGNAMLRNAACALVVWFTTGMQGELSEVEYARRKTQYQDAMKLLADIRSGSITLTAIADSDYDPPMISSTQRIDEMF